MKKIIEKVPEKKIKSFWRKNLKKKSKLIGDRKNFLMILVQKSKKKSKLIGDQKNYDLNFRAKIES